MGEKDSRLRPAGFGVASSPSVSRVGVASLLSHNGVGVAGSVLLKGGRGLQLLIDDS